MTRYQILQHPNEHGQAIDAVQHHQKVFEHPPNLVTGDRGVHSPETEVTLKEAGVKRVAIPASGKRIAKNARRWNIRAASGAAIGGVRVSRAGSRACDAIMAGVKVPTTGKRGWSGGWVWASSEVDLRHIAQGRRV